MTLLQAILPTFPCCLLINNVRCLEDFIRPDVIHGSLSETCRVSQQKVDTSNFQIVQIPAACTVKDPCQISYFLQILVNYDNC